MPTGKCSSHLFIHLNRWKPLRKITTNQNAELCDHQPTKTSKTQFLPTSLNDHYQSGNGKILIARGTKKKSSMRLCHPGMSETALRTLTDLNA